MTSDRHDAKRRTEGVLAILATLVIAFLVGAEFGMVYFFGAMYVLAFVVAAMHVIVSVALLLFMTIRMRSLRAGWRLVFPDRTQNALLTLGAVLVAAFVMTMHDSLVFPYACILAGFIGGLIAVVGIIRGRC